MTTTPWQGDACSLVDAFRSGERTPVEEVEATLAAIEGSGLNAFSYVDADGARAAAATSDVELPFGGLPLGVKELDRVEGWPYTEASVPLRDETSPVDSTYVERLRRAGCIPVGLTTASEFGGVNFTRTELNGVTRNPWNPERTPGGSSGGTSAAVAGGILTLGTAGDGGGSIRIPAGFTGLFGLKCTYGRIPKGPFTEIGPLTAVVGCLSRSVRDTARLLDVVNGHHPRDPLSLPRTEGWEAGLGTRKETLRGLRVAVLVDLAGAAVVHPAVAALVEEAAEQLIGLAHLERVEAPLDLPRMGAAWSLASTVGVRTALGDRWPDCADELTPEMRYGVGFAESRYDLAAAAKVEQRRTRLFEAMADLFEVADLVIAASNPDVAFAAEGPMPAVVGGVEVGVANNGALTIPSNVYGNPAMSVPVGTVDGMPVGMQVLAPHFAEPLLLDLALLLERERAWPLVAPGAPC